MIYYLKKIKYISISHTITILNLMIKHYIIYHVIIILYKYSNNTLFIILCKIMLGTHAIIITQSLMYKYTYK